MIEQILGRSCRRMERGYRRVARLFSNLSAGTWSSRSQREASESVAATRAPIGAVCTIASWCASKLETYQSPTSVARKLRRSCAMGRTRFPPPKELPALDDTEGWKVYVTETDAFVRSLVGEATAGFKGSIEIETSAHVRSMSSRPRVSETMTAECSSTSTAAPGSSAAETCARGRRSRRAESIKVRVWSVDYRMPPEDPFPAPLDDCLTAYRLLLDEREPSEIVVGGTSAGGNLAAALVLRACDERHFPCLRRLSSTLARSTSQDRANTWQINDGLDNVLSGPSSPVPSSMPVAMIAKSPTSPRSSETFADSLPPFF